jgi:serine O-acetyltransferase
VTGGGVSREDKARLQALLRENARLRPGLRHALTTDAARASRARGETFGQRGPRAWWNVLRLCWTSDDFAGLALYRIRCAVRDAGIPIIPAILNRVCIAFWGINIDDAIVIREGLRLPHGNVVLGGITVIGRNVTVCPWASIGCRQGSFIGPTLGDDVFVGTHSSILGTMTIGDGAAIGAGSVVVGDVQAGTSVAGVPAKPIVANAPELMRAELG